MLLQHKFWKTFSAKDSFNIWIIFLIFAATLLRFFLISRQSLWLDEGLSLARSNGQNLSDIFDNLNATPYDKYQPTYFVLLYLWRELFGNSVAAVRSLSATLSAASVILVTLTSLKLYGKRHALWSTALVSFSAFHIYYAQEVRAYSLVLLLTSLELYLFSDVLVDRPIKVTSKILFWVVTGIACLSSIFVFIFTFAICVSHILVYRDTKRWLRWWFPILLCLLPAIFFYLSSPFAEAINFHLKSWYGTSILQNFLFVSYGLLTGTTYLAPLEQLRGPDRIQILISYWSHVLILLASVTAILYNLGRKILTASRIRKATSVHKASLFLAVLILLCFSFSAVFAMITGINWVPRHSCYILPLITILAPFSFRQISDESTCALTSSALMGTILLIFLNVYSLGNYFFNPEYARDDYKSAAHYVINQDDPETRSILLFGNMRLLNYYGDTKTVKVSGNEIGEDQISRVVLDSTEKAEEILVLVNREFMLNFSVEPALSDRYRLLQKEEFQFFKVYRFERTQ